MAQRFSRRSILAALAGIVAAVLITASPFGGGAHEHRTVGNYELVIGFLNEPAISGELNGLSLRVTQVGGAAGTPAADVAATPAATEAEATPVRGLEDTLQAEVIYGDQKMTLTLEPAWNDPGAYEAIFIPTAPGDYTFHIWGTIDGTAIDETSTSGPDSFSTVIDRSTLEFPPTR